MDNLSLTVSDKDANGHLTEVGEQKMREYVESYMNGRTRFRVSTVARNTGVHWNTAMQYIKEYIEHKREEIVESDGAILPLIKDKMYKILDEVEEKTESLDLEKRKKALTYQLELVDRIMQYKKLEAPSVTLDDLKEQNVLMSSMGDRMADFLAKKFAMEGKVIEQSDGTKSTR
jgi:hypothetical protein